MSPSVCVCVCVFACVHARVSYRSLPLPLPLQSIRIHRGDQNPSLSPAHAGSSITFSISMKPAAHHKRET